MGLYVDYPPLATKTHYQRYTTLNCRVTLWQRFENNPGLRHAQRVVPETGVISAPIRDRQRSDGMTALGALSSVCLGVRILLLIYECPAVDFSPVRRAFRLCLASYGLLWRQPDLTRRILTTYPE
jgi:hypothetical protein